MCIHVSLIPAMARTGYRLSATVTPEGVAVAVAAVGASSRTTRTGHNLVLRWFIGTYREKGKAASTSLTSRFSSASSGG